MNNKDTANMDKPSSVKNIRPVTTSTIDSSSYEGHFKTYENTGKASFYLENRKDGNSYVIFNSESKKVPSNGKGYSIVSTSSRDAYRELNKTINTKK